MRWLLPLLLLLAPLSASADELVREFDVAAGGRLQIALATGNVEVVAHDGDRVRLEATARGVGASGVRFEVQRSDDTLILESHRDAWLGWLRTGPRVHVRAWVPRDLSLDIETAGRIVTHEDGVERSFPAHAARYDDAGETLASH